MNVPVTFISNVIVFLCCNKSTCIIVGCWLCLLKSHCHCLLKSHCACVCICVCTHIIGIVYTICTVFARIEPPHQSRLEAGDAPGSEVDIGQVSNKCQVPAVSMVLPWFSLILKMFHTIFAVALMANTCAISTALNGCQVRSALTH